jgi:diguanylate cyclase (GGDEF)-like protein/PAS domain S-box-containing protein
MVDVAQWRLHILDNILRIVLVLGFITCIPSILLAVSEGRWYIGVADAIALAWLVRLSVFRSMSYQWRALNFLGLMYAMGVFLLMAVGPVSQVYLMAVPVLTALLVGLRGAVIALAINALTMYIVTAFGNVAMHAIGFDGQPLLQALIITINFIFVDAVMTISCAVLINGLEAAMGRQRAVALSLSREQENLRQANDELRITSAAVAHLNDIVIMLSPEPVDSDSGAIIIFVNHAFELGTGYTAEEVIGKPAQFLMGPRTSVFELNRIREARRKWQPVRTELICYTKSHREILLEFDIVPVAAVKKADETGAISATEFTHWIAVVRDITERKRAEDDIHQLAYYDALTGLPNRRLLLDRMGLLLSTSIREGEFGAVLFIDLDQFKNVNDARGHTVGDVFLKLVAQRLAGLIRSKDTVARLGGDEFVVLITGLTPNLEAAALRTAEIGEKIRNALQKPFELDGKSYTSGASIGATLLPRHGQTVDDLLREADTAMYRAKATGRNRLAFFEHTMQYEVEERLMLESDLAQAIVGQQMTMVMQPQFNQEGEADGVELLMRWHHPERGAVPPVVFIPLAESSGMILHLGDWVLRQGCETFLRLQEAGKPVPVSINVSPRQFHQSDFVARVQRALHETGAPAKGLIFELTEGLLIENLDDTIARMNELAAMGIRFSIDDFGTGYSSLAYLKRLPLYELKIDRSFVLDTPEDSSATAIVDMIVSMAQHLGLRVVAEGVETREQADFLVASGCDAMQGYLFARPMPLQEWLTVQGQLQLQ